ncbi:hypothetical protein F4677DRAFT_83451 [Hypoxylon crocopeplum]|nr:hypothetical protein F4677DRAFT_83451 [Hypoxylon crocopeplum]
MATIQAPVAQAPHLRGLEQLPVELLGEILSAIDELPSLFSASLASRTLHDAFTKAKRTILSRVLLNHVGFDMIPDALVAVESIDATREGWDAFLVEPAQVPNLLTMDQIYSIAKVSAAVRAFAKLFVQSATGVRPDIQIRSPLPSESELARIEHTFYRFEIFRNIFRTLLSDPLTFEKATNSFFAALAPWEAEQLGCIHDFFFHQIQPAYDDIASHDIVWGSIEVEPALNYASPEVQAIMSSGLAAVYRIATAKTYAERHELLYQRNGPDRRDKFLCWALRHYSWLQLQQQSPGAPFTPGRDRDRGPQDAWEWAYANCAPRAEAYRLDRTDLRKWGYVLWDRARLQEISLFREPFCPPLHFSEEHEVDAEFEASWRARERIARAGGTGYWSVADQSQIVYPATRQSGRHQRGPPRVGPTFANAKRDFGAASARIEAAMQNKKTRTAN